MQQQPCNGMRKVIAPALEREGKRVSEAGAHRHALMNTLQASPPDKPPEPVSLHTPIHTSAALHARATPPAL